jgi:lipid A 3-O-deacylase
MRYLIIVVTLLTAFSAFGQSPLVRPMNNEKTFTLQEEDDSLVKPSLASDRGYTNGTRMLWSWTPDKDDRLGKLAAIVCRHEDETMCERAVTTGIGQNMYTPEYLRSTQPIRGDRPYGGWLYGTLMFDATRLTTNDHIELYAGVIGRDSHADDAQIFWHKHVTPAAPDPIGWKTQIGEWAAFLATYERRVKLLPRHVPDGRPEWFDLSSAIGAAAGNVFINGSVGVTARLGYNLPGQFVNSIKSSTMAVRMRVDGLNVASVKEQARRESPPDWDAYVYVVTNASYAARNVFIDAEADQYLIKRRSDVREHRAGATFRVHHFRFAYQQTWRSSEFRPLVRNISHSDRPHSYGMVMISVGPNP